MANGPKRPNRRRNSSRLIDDQQISGGKAFQDLVRDHRDRSKNLGRRKSGNRADPNTRINPMTGRPERVPQHPLGKNPLDVKQFPDAPPERDIPGLPPFELPSDFPEPGKNVPEGFDPIGDTQRMRKRVDSIIEERGLRSALEKKKLDKRKQRGMEEAMQRRSRRSGRRVFRDPQNLSRFVRDFQDQRQDEAIAEMQANRPVDMDDTIVDGPDGQQFRYDSEVDKFTPVNFNPRTNRYESALPDEDKKGGGGGGGGGGGSQTDAFKIAKSNFDKQMTELRKLSETDEQFGDTYREFQQEYNEILRSPDLRPEERDAALTDLFDRGAETFEQTSGYRRQAAEAEQQQKAQAAKAKQAEKLEYDNRRAVEAKEKIRRDQENARYEDRKIRQKHSATTQELDKAYEQYQKQFESQQDANFLSDPNEKPISMQEFTAQHYRRMHEDEEISDQIRDTDGRISIIETEIGQLEGEDPMAYRDTLTEIYGVGRQEEADAAFQDYQNTRAARIAGAKRRLNEMKSLRKDLINSKSLVYDEKYRSAAAQQDRKAQNLEAINEARRVQEEERQGVVSRLSRSGRQIERIQEGTREVARGTEKLATREVMLQRDSNPMSPTFGQSTRMDSPEYIKDITGDRTLLGDLRRLAESEKDMDKRKKYGGEEVYRQKRTRAIEAIEGVIQKENPAGSDGHSAIQDPQELRRQAADRLAQIMRFEQSLSEEQMGDRG